MPPLFFSGRRGRRIGRRSLAGDHKVGEIDALVHLADHNLLIAMVTCGVRHTVQFGRRSLSPKPDEPDAARQLRAAPSTELVGYTVNSFPANAAPATGRHTMLKLVARASFFFRFSAAACGSMASFVQCGWAWHALLCYGSNTGGSRGPSSEQRPCFPLPPPLISSVARAKPAGARLHHGTRVSAPSSTAAPFASHQRVRRQRIHAGVQFASATCAVHWVRCCNLVTHLCAVLSSAAGLWRTPTCLK